MTRKADDRVEEAKAFAESQGFGVGTEHSLPIMDGTREIVVYFTVSYITTKPASVGDDTVVYAVLVAKGQKNLTREYRVGDLGPGRRQFVR